MRNKLISLILAAALIASLCGCASIFEKEYFSATTYEDADSDTAVSTDGATEVDSYFRIKLGLSRLISAHRESGTFKFRNYDGDVYDDIAAACKDVGANTALGAYCVDYISYDVNRIVAYYEANVYISYKRTEAEMSGIITISTSDGLRECVEKALDDFRESLVVMVNASLIGGEDASEIVDAVCREDPLLCANKPEVNVSVYAGGGLQKLFEFNIDYGAGREELLSEREALTGAVDEIAKGITAESDAYRAFQAAALLVNVCSSDKDAGDTAYAAVIGGAADSEGMAMAYRAVCAAADISCLVVEGRLNSEQHYWNMIEADGNWYHVDVSRAIEAGFAQTFLLGDSFMLGRYWWDTELYHACDGDLSYSTVILAQQNT